MRLTLLGILFVVVVIAISVHQQSLLIPLFIGMSTTLKSLVKLLTPKFVVLFFKNSVFLKIKQILIKASTRFVVLSHKPWRHRIRWLKTTASSTALQVLQLYLKSPLWLRTTIALGLLIATASSSYLVIALLIIPQPILRWARKKILTTLNRTGVTHVIKVAYKFLIPVNVRNKWYMHSKWTMGRRQVQTAQKLRGRFIDRNTLPPSVIDQ